MSSAPSAEPDGFEFPSLSVLKSAHLKLIQREGAQPETDQGQPAAAGMGDPDFLRDVRAFMVRGRATGRVLDIEKERSAAQTMLNYWGTVLLRAGESERSMPPAALLEWDASVERDLDESQCPYLGLDAFSQKNAHLFTGRETLLDAWIDKLTGRRLLAILGPSGCGRTSLLQAGLLPRLRAGEIRGSGDWRYLEASLTDDDLLDTLIGAFPAAPRAEWRAALRHDPARLAELDAATPALLVLDRFEDVFLRTGEAQRRPLLTALAAWCGESRRIVISARVDAAAGIRQWIEQQLGERGAIVFVPGFTARELRTAVEAPAEGIGLRFEEGLVDALVDELAGEPSALALLQFVLLQLWDARIHHRIPLAAYHRLGGAQQAVETVAEDLYRGLDERDAARVKALFLRLVRPSLVSRDLIVMRVPFDSVVASPEEREHFTRIVRLFEKARLLRRRSGADGRECIEATHESLLRKWPRLIYDWLEESRDLLRQRQRIGLAASQWRQHGKSHSALWSGSLLGEALGIRHQLSPEEAEFVDESARVDRRRRAVRIALVTAIITGLAAGLVHSYWQNERLERRNDKITEQREELQARKEALEQADLRNRNDLVQMDEERAARLLEAGDPAGAFLWFAQAERDEPDKEKGGKLHQWQLGAAWRQMPRLEAFVFDQDLSRSALGTDGKSMVTVSKHGAKLWQLAAGAPAKEVPLVSGRAVTWVSAHPEKRLFLTAGAAGRDGEATEKQTEIRVWDAEGKPAGTPILLAEGAAQRGWFSPAADATHVVVTGSAPDGRTGSVSVWNYATGQMEAGPLGHSLPVNWAAFSPDGETLVTAAGTPHDGAEGSAKIWAWKKRLPPVEVPHEGGPAHFAEWNWDGSQAVIASGAFEGGFGAGRVWSYTKPAGNAAGQVVALTAPLNHAGAVARARFSPDGRWLATASYDRTVRLWHVRTQKSVLELRHDGDVYSAAFSPDGRFLATGGRDRQARVWEIATGKLAQPPLYHTETVSEVAFSRNGRSVHTNSRHAARLWSAVLEEPRAPLLDVTAVDAAVSGDGRWVATASDRGIIEIWNSATGQLTEEKPKLERGVLVALSSRGDRLAVASPSPQAGQPARARLYRLGADGKPAPDPIAIELPGEAASLAFNADASLLAAICLDAKGEARVIGLWETAKGERDPATPGVQDLAIQSLHFSPGGSYLLALCSHSAIRRGEARVWKLGASAGAPAVLRHDEERITSAAFHPGESLILTGGIDDEARLWAISGSRVEPRSILRIRSGKNQEAQRAHTADLTAVAFSPQGTRAITASKDQTAVLWDVSDPAQPAAITVLRHPSVVEEVAFSAEGDLALTATREPRLRVWSVDNGGLVAVLNASGELLKGTLGSSGGRVVSLSQEFVSRNASKGSAGLAARDRRRITPLTWSLAPIGLDFGRATDLGELISARRLDAGEHRELQLADVRDLRATWNRDAQTYISRAAGRPSERKFHLAAANQSEATRQWFAAAWHLEQFMAHPDHKPTPKTQAELFWRIANDYADAEEWPMGMVRGVAYMRRAADGLEKGDTRAPHRFRTLAGLHETLALQTGNAEHWDAALAAFERALEADPKHIATHISLGEAHASRRDYARASEIFGKVLGELDPPNTRARHRLMITALLLGDEAALARARALRDELGRPEGELPKDAVELVWPAVLSVELESEKNRALRWSLEAILRRALEREPDNFSHRNTLGALLYRDGRHAEAIRELEAARASLVARNVAQLAQAYDRAIRAPITDSSSVDGRPQDWAFLAMAHARLGNYAAAERWINKLRDAPELVHLHSTGHGRQPVPWSTLILEVLYRQAEDVVQRRAPVTRLTP